MTGTKGLRETARETMRRRCGMNSPGLIIRAVQWVLLGTGVLFIACVVLSFLPPCSRPLSPEVRQEVIEKDVLRLLRLISVDSDAMNDVAKGVSSGLTANEAVTEVLIEREYLLRDRALEYGHIRAIVRNGVARDTMTDAWGVPYAMELSGGKVIVGEAGTMNP
jgi:hypothetical protein